MDWPEYLGGVVGIRVAAATARRVRPTKDGMPRRGLVRLQLDREPQRVLVASRGRERVSPRPVAEPEVRRGGEAAALVGAGQVLLVVLHRFREALLGFRVERRGAEAARSRRRRASEEHAVDAHGVDR